MVNWSFGKIRLPYIGPPSPSVLTFTNLGNYSSEKPLAWSSMSQWAPAHGRPLSLFGGHAPQCLQAQSMEFKARTRHMWDGARCPLTTLLLSRHANLFLWVFSHSSRISFQARDSIIKSGRFLGELARLQASLCGIDVMSNLV